LIFDFPGSGDHYPESVVVVERVSRRSVAYRSSPPSRLPDRIASVFLFLALFGKQIDYLLSV
jgi:hypothetical protein